MKSTDATLQASYDFCRRSSRRSGSNFYLGFFLLPRAKRRAMDALYAFMRYSDDLIDAGPPSESKRTPEILIDRRREHLNSWRKSLENALLGNATSSADCKISSHQILDSQATAMVLLPALVDTVRKFHIPFGCLYAVLDGVEMDLDRHRYETFAELHNYSQRVASAVGLACIHIWGFRGQGTPQAEAAFEPARRAGIALQLTNILRDLNIDAAIDRIYLPSEDLRSSGYSAEELKIGVVNEGFRRLMALEIDRAAQFYRQACKLFDFLHCDGQRIFGLIIQIYWRLLKKIARQPSDVFGSQIGISKIARLYLAALWSIWPSRMMNKIKAEINDGIAADFK